MMEEQIELNSPEYIQTTIDKLEPPQDKLKKLGISIKIAGKTLFYGKKWLIYLAITMIPIFFGLVGPDKLLGDATSSDAYTNNLRNPTLTLLFTFGALLISLPFTADEISDNIMEGYIVRPVDREILYAARWFVGVVGIWIVNSLISIIYYIYFHAFSETAFEFFFDDIWLLFNSFWLMFVASLLYASVFVFIGVIGNKGFTFGIIVAMIETFFINLIFLANNLYIPSTHVKYLADQMFGDYYSYQNAPSDLTSSWSTMYVLIFVGIFFVIGQLYFRNREFNE